MKSGKKSRIALEEGQPIQRQFLASYYTQCFTSGGGEGKCRWLVWGWRASTSFLLLLLLLVILTINKSATKEDQRQEAQETSETTTTTTTTTERREKGCQGKHLVEIS